MGSHLVGHCWHSTVYFGCIWTHFVQAQSSRSKIFSSVHTPNISLHQKKVLYVCQQLNRLILIKYVNNVVVYVN
jgi:hypothetical protein